VRIISGFAKGLSLATPPTDEWSIRPTSDKAREALFSILGDRVKRARVLDLFSGTGAIGLEAFSRGASFVVFVDKSSLALKLTKKNILKCFNKTMSQAEIRVVQQNLNYGYKIDNGEHDIPEVFDLIFADPPYGKNLSGGILRSLDQQQVLDRDGLLVIEERADIQLPENLKVLHLKEKRVYGETAFFIYSC